MNKNITNTNKQPDSGSNYPLDLQNFARRAVAYCITQTASRHAGQHVFIGEIFNAPNKIREQARLAQLTHDELSQLSENERLDRFRAAFLNDKDMSMVHTLFINLCNNFEYDMNRQLKDIWKIEEERILEISALSAGLDGSIENTTSKDAHDIDTNQRFSWIKPWTWRK